MTGFAQRLVARSAGHPTGLPLLTPRPASRFETSDPPVLDEVTETKAAAQTARVTGPASDPADAPVASQPQGRLNESPGAKAAEHENPMPAQRPQSDAPLSKGRAAPPDQFLPMVSPQSPERANVETQHPEHPAKGASIPASITRRAERSVALADQAMATPLTPTMTADEVKMERPAAPAISIGRIEVQFLAPEKPAAAPRPEPQRTRGFDAYARARRGMPR